MSVNALATTHTSAPALTPAVENYLKAIYTLQQREAAACTNALCAQLGGLKPGSVSGMLRRLEELGLVQHQLYQGARLTPAGERAALALIRNHRLLETFLVQALGYSWDEVHVEAEALEHHLSPKLTARIAAWLGEPHVDPHGDPIPTADGTLPAQSGRRLNDLAPGTSATVLRVIDQGAAQLRYLASLGLVPGAVVTVLAAGPFEGPLTVAVAEQQQHMSYELGHTLVVSEEHAAR